MTDIIKETRWEWGGELNLVEDASMDMIEATMTDNSNQFPQQNEDKPFVGVVYNAGAFTKQISGSGVAGTPSAQAELYKAMAMSEVIVGGTSVTYAWTGDITGDATAFTIDRAAGNTFKQSMTNSLGTGVFSFRPGQPVRLAMALDGLYIEPTEASLSNALNGDATPVVAKGLSATVNAAGLLVKEFTLDMGIETNSPNEDIASANGVDNPDIISAPPPVWDLLVERPALATLNFMNLFTTQTKLSLVIPLGTVAGNIITFTSDGFMVEPPRQPEAAGNLMQRIRFKCSTASGDTALTIVET